MIDRRVHVGVEAVGLRILDLPGVDRRPFDEAQLDDRLDALEAVLPRDDQTNRRAVLIRQHFAVESDGKDGQRMHGFVEPQAFHVRPLERVGALLRKLSDIVESDELHEARLRRGFDALDDIGQRNADPRNHQRPRFDAAEAVDALLEYVRLDEVFERVRGRLRDVPFDRDLPRARAESSGQLLRTVAGARVELIEVVETGDVIVGVGRCAGAERALAYTFKLATTLRRDGPAESGPSGGGGPDRERGRGRLHERAAVEIHLLWRDLGTANPSH